MSFRKVSHVLFDMDGLLINSEALYTVAFDRVIKKYGGVFTWELKVSIMGLQSHEFADKVIKELKLDVTPKQFLSELQEHYEELFPNVELMPGAKKLIHHLYDNKIPIALATSSSKASADLKQRNLRDIFQLFHHMTMGSSDPEVKLGKPHPDIFLVCASRFPDKPKPEDCLVFEDAPNGVLSAVAAGMQVVMVPDPRMPEELTRPATLVLASLEEFEPQLFGLPPYVDSC